jgi:DNA mismatch repair protein MutL
MTAVKPPAAMPIRLLDERLISQIAAGEVVERPASVVKELIENSLDAGAREIRVDVEQGGLRRITVADDGAGMARDELPLALARHATSKIDSLAGLETIASLGFRGEALAAIAAVAELTLTSRINGAEHGHEIAPDGSLRPAACPPGTRVAVRELFAHIPARRKFLRSPATEFRHIQKALNQLALSRFDVGFALFHDGREIARLAPCAANEAHTRVAQLAVEAFDAHALRVDESAGGMHLGGWIATPGFSRGQADLQYSYVNTRAVRDKVISHAVRAAYRDLLHHQRHPAFVLYLALDARAIDVNAHPAKAEIRFRQSGLVHDFILRGIARALAAGESQPHAARAFDLPVQRTEDESQKAVSQAARAGAGCGNQALNFSSASLGEARASYQFQRPGQAPAAAETAPPQSEPDAPTLGYAIGQLHAIYILAENTDGLIVVDMHAAHERVLYERLKAEYSAGEIQTKRLLVPATLSLSEAEAEAVERHARVLAAVGLEATRSGPNTALLRGMPALLAHTDYLTLVRDVIGGLDGALNGGNGTRNALDDVLADMGCKAAIKAGRRLTLVEMNALLRDMAHTDRAGHCNHGRPSWIQVDRAGLDRLFMRGQ